MSYDVAESEKVRFLTEIYGNRILKAMHDGDDGTVQIILHFLAKSALLEEPYFKEIVEQFGLYQKPQSPDDFPML